MLSAMLMGAARGVHHEVFSVLCQKLQAAVVYPSTVPSLSTYVSKYCTSCRKLQCAADLRNAHSVYLQVRMLAFT